VTEGAEARGQLGGVEHPPPAIDLGDIEFRADTSRLAPGLVYTWAFYTDPSVSHGWYRLPAASRGGKVRVIDSPSDWTRVVGAWFPADAGEAERACEEMVGVVKIRDLRVTTYEPGRPLEAFLVYGQEALARYAVDSTRVTRSGSSWQVEKWFVERRKTTRYVCRFERKPHGSYLYPAVTIHEAGFL